MNLQVQDVEDLHGRILEAWEELDQRIIDKAVGEWRKLELLGDILSTNFDW